MSQEHASINGALLRLRREARGWVQTDVATRACMSVKQIRQLEEGGLSAFYSEAVKVTAAKKVGALLGLTQDEVFSHGQPEVAIATSSLSPEEDLATLLASTHSGHDEEPMAAHQASSVVHELQHEQSTSPAHPSSDTSSAMLEGDALVLHASHEPESVTYEVGQTARGVVDGHAAGDQPKAVSASSTGANLNASMAPTKSKFSLLWILALFVGAIVLAAVLRPDPEPVATEPPPPLQPALQGEADAPKEGGASAETSAASSSATAAPNPAAQGAPTAAIPAAVTTPPNPATASAPVSAAGAAPAAVPAPAVVPAIPLAPPAAPAKAN